MPPTQLRVKTDNIFIGLEIIQLIFTHSKYIYVLHICTGMQEYIIIKCWLLFFLMRIMDSDLFLSLLKVVGWFEKVQTFVNTRHTYVGVQYYKV